MPIILVDISGYSSGGYWCLIMLIILMAIGGYYINGLVDILLMDIGGY